MARLILLCVFSLFCLSQTYADSYQTTFVNLLNAKRASSGIDSLQIDDDLQKRAQKWAQHMADNRDFRTDPNANAFQVIHQNYAGGFTASGLLNSWFQFSTRANLMKGDLKKIGVAHAYSGTASNHMYAYVAFLTW